MTDDSRQTARSRVGEAEKQLRIVRQSLPEADAEILALIDEATRDVKTIQERIEAAEQREQGCPPRRPPARESGTTEPEPIEGQSPEAPDTGSSSDESGHENSHSEEPHAR